MKNATSGHISEDVDVSEIIVRPTDAAMKKRAD